MGGRALISTQSPSLLAGGVLGPSSPEFTVLGSLQRGDSDLQLPLIILLLEEKMGADGGGRPTDLVPVLPKLARTRVQSVHATDRSILKPNKAV